MPWTAGLGSVERVISRRLLQHRSSDSDLDSENLLAICYHNDNDDNALLKQEQGHQHGLAQMPGASARNRRMPW